MLNLELLEFNPILAVDSYKTTQYLQYPPKTEVVYSYIEARVGGVFDDIQVAGVQAYVKKYLNIRITQRMIDEADLIITGMGYRFNRAGWEYILHKHNGKLPLRIKAVAEGTIVETGTVILTVENTDENCFWLTSYIETGALRGVWYVSTVATISYNAKRHFKSAMDISSDDYSQLPFRLHDFGARGTSSGESAGLGGVGHLFNFMGTDTIEGVVAAYRYYNQPLAGFSVNACYDSDTDILTSSGWVNFSDLDYSYKVAQVDTNANISYITPHKIVNNPYKGDMIKFSTKSRVAAVDLLVTPNHRMVRRSKSIGIIEIDEASVFTSSHRNEWLMGGELTIEGVELTAIERLKIAFQADGSFMSRKTAYTGGRTGTYPIRFSLFKSRKKEALRSIIDESGLSYTETTSDKKLGYSYFQLNIPIDVEFVKDFSWVVPSSRSTCWREEFISELSRWDGHTTKNGSIVYSSNTESCIDVVQEMCVVSGMRCKKSIKLDERINRQTNYRCTITNVPYRNGVNISKEVVEYEGSVHCVTVDTGMVLVRRNGCVSVSGNSEHSTITSWLQKNEAGAYRNMITQFGEHGQIISIVSDSYDLFKAIDIYATMKDDIIARGCKLVVRPDSGEHTDILPKVLQRLDEIFGSDINDKKYKVLRNCGVLWGDGIDKDTIEVVIQCVLDAGFSIDNVVLGMGGGLLQHCDRDWGRWAMKCSAAKVDGEWRDVYKQPKTDLSKSSKRGRFDDQENLRIVFEDGKLLVDETLETIRERVESQAA